MSYCDKFKVFVDVFILSYFLPIIYLRRGGVTILAVNPNIPINIGHQWFANYIPTIPTSLKNSNYRKRAFQLMACHAIRVILG